MGIIALNRSEGGAKTGVFLDLHSSTPKHLYLTVMMIHEMMVGDYTGNDRGADYPHVLVMACERTVYVSVEPTRISEGALASWRFKSRSIDIQA